MQRLRPPPTLTLPPPAHFSPSPSTSRNNAAALHSGHARSASVAGETPSTAAQLGTLPDFRVKGRVAITALVLVAVAWLPQHGFPRPICRRRRRSRRGVGGAEMLLMWQRGCCDATGSSATGCFCRSRQRRGSNYVALAGSLRMAFPAALHQLHPDEANSNPKPDCSAWGCQCGIQAGSYRFQSDEDYHTGHPAVRELVAWRKAAGEPPPRVYQAPGGPCGWRTRAKLAVGPAPGKGLAIGLFREGTHEVVSAADCKAHHPAINAAIRTLQQALASLHGAVAPFDHAARASWSVKAPALRYVQLTVERGSGLVQLVLVWNGARGHPGAFDLEALLQRLWSSEDRAAEPWVKRRPPWHSIWVHWRQPDPRRLRAVFSRRPDAWEQVRPEPRREEMSFSAGPPEELDVPSGEVLEHLDGLPFAFGPASFQQANLAVFEQVLRDMKAALRSVRPRRKARQPAEGQPELRLLELHSGVGVIGLSLARAAAIAVAAEPTQAGVLLLSSDENPHCAGPFTVNARRLFTMVPAGTVSSGKGPHTVQPGQVRFLAMNATSALRRSEGLGPFDVLVLDPPRRGLARREDGRGLVGAAEAAALIRSCPGLRAVLYMSCGHTSFMEDADRLIGKDPSASGEGWGPPFQLAALACYDMFPFTPHVETLGVFLREDFQ